MKEPRTERTRAVSGSSEVAVVVRIGAVTAYCASTLGARRIGHFPAIPRAIARMISVEVAGE
jgi:hypothetical protein